MGYLVHATAIESPFFPSKLAVAAAAAATGASTNYKFQP